MVRNIRALPLLLCAILLFSACGGSSEPEGPPLTDQELAGKRIFVTNCAACHATVPDTVIVGPSLFGVSERAETRVEGEDARTYIETSILDPSAYVNEGFSDLMPKTFGRTLTGEELDAVVAYLFTLK